VDPERSSRAAARRIVEEVLAEHAARASALDGVAPIVIQQRPDTPAWRAARRIVEETLAEHAARAVVPGTLGLDVTVDLDEDDVEVVLTFDGPPSPPTARQRGRETSLDPSTTVRVVAPIEADETPARAARRIAESTLVERGVELRVGTENGSENGTENGTEQTPAGDAPIAYEVDPVPALEPDPVSERAVDPEPALEPDPVPDPADSLDPDPAPATASPQGQVEPLEPDTVRAEVPLSAAEERLRNAIPEQLFAPLAEPDQADPEPTAEHPSPEILEAIDVPSAPPSPPVPEAILKDPDDPTVIASRIVAEVLAARTQAALDELRAQEPELPDAEAEVPETQEPELQNAEAEVPVPAHGDDVPEVDRSDDGPPQDDGVSAANVTAVLEPVADPVAPLSAQRLDGVHAADLAPDITDGPGDELWGADLDGSLEPDRSWVPEPALVAGESDMETGELSDPLWDDEPSARAPAGALGEEDLGSTVAVDQEFGSWPDPVTPPRRTGRWLVATVVGALALALLLPLTIGALRDLLSFS
jgi:hypothetical protein